jgi:hypothetical protein
VTRRIASAGGAAHSPLLVTCERGQRVRAGLRRADHVNELQIVLAAEITNLSTDFSQLAPMVDATLAELEHAGIDPLPEAIAADAG